MLKKRISEPANLSRAKIPIHRVMGVDPGSRRTGYAVIERRGNKLVPIALGVIKPKETLPFEKRLLIIFEEICSLIKTHNPNGFSVESLYSHKNALSAIKLGQARGVILLAAAQAGLPVFDYAPAIIKKGFTGYGNAPKIQIQNMARYLLGLKQNPAEDAADALAIALCHLNQR